MRLKSLAKKYKTDKLILGYIKKYEKYFNSKQYEEITLVEVGVLEGKSLKMWRDYFPNGKIYGIDIFKHKTAESDFKMLNKEGRIKVYKADQNNKKQMKDVIKEILKHSGNKGIDIAIDDGMHYNHSLVHTFGRLFPHLNSDGIYVAEDVAYCNENTAKKGKYKNIILDVRTQFKEWEKTGKFRVMTSSGVEDELLSIEEQDYISKWIRAIKIPNIIRKSMIAVFKK